MHAMLYNVRLANARRNSQWDFKWMHAYAAIWRTYGSPGSPSLEEADYYADLFGQWMTDLIGEAGIV
jgi:hypothetical protein